ncbi:MBT domain-containing protein 1-like isoform X2 [Daktulosphaira vitifoliae]|uniref:MBT domain-containing protein 1-like isoform X2 n=1 Tax=Daktulosphaira vitifoliae TaxID=58002 RepID=UPI0021A9ABAA|nr:MBT domain-containing protein 1-like isoform X2 [Daktulosphaira vitifoliae]
MSSESLHKNCDDEDNTFDWTKYLRIRCAEEVPEDFFCHVCKSEQNGIELGSVIEVENEDGSGYWFASITLSKGVLICLRYYGDESDTNDFWIVVKSPRIHNLNWGNENGKELIPPHPERFQRVNLKVMKEKVLDCEHIVSEKVLQLEGAPIFNVFKPGMCVEIQDRDYPYRVWISKILNNVGGRLLLEMLGDDSPEKEPFWLFYLNERVFPMGWAEQKGLPWRVINPNVDLNDTIDSNVLLNVLKPQTPKQHSYKLGEVLEVLSPHSLMIFYTAKIIKIYDNRYFKIEVNDNHNVDKRFTFLATKENPYLFNAGWANKHKLVLKPPFDWDSELPFNWLEYIKKNNLKFATIDKICQKNIECIKVGMKLEAVDPVYPDKIRIATIKEVLDHWVILTFDRSNWYQELLHVRSIYSDEIFPVGWCNKHKYTLSSPQSLYINCDTYISYYYKSDFEINLNDEDIDDLTKCNFYVKNDFYFHSKHKDTKLYEDIGLENTYIDNKPDLKNDLVIPHTMLKTEVLNHEISELENKSKSEEFKLVQQIKSDDIFKSSPSFKSNVNKKFYIHFNKDCYPGNHTVKRKITALPNNIGPGFVSKVLQEAISIFVSLDYYPWVALKKIKKLQHLLYNEPGGVVKMVSTKATKFHEKHVEYLLLPESKKLAQIYCATLCNLSGMCENFMTTIKTQCSHGCKLKALKTSNKSSVDSAITEKSKVKNSVDKNEEKTGSLIEKICKVGN